MVVKFFVFLEVTVVVRIVWHPPCAIRYRNWSLWIQIIWGNTLVFHRLVDFHYPVCCLR
jgi:hypothetical protein